MTGLVLENTDFYHVHCSFFPFFSVCTVSLPGEAPRDKAASWLRHCLGHRCSSNDVQVAD